MVDQSNSVDRSLEEAEQMASERFRSANPRSETLYHSAQMTMPGGNTRTALHYDPFPLYIEKSEGAHVIDADGHRYLDVLGEFTAGIFGHSDPLIGETVSDALSKGVSNGAPGAAEIELSQIMTERFPAVEKIRFCNTGTEANLYALTLAKSFTGRQKVMVFEGAYHGGVFVFATGGSPMNVPFDWIVARYNDIEVTRKLLAENAGELAAVIIEPMMSNGGCIAADVDFMQMLRDECSSCGALLVFDEVVTSRMGAEGLQGRLNIHPDLTTFGKYIGAGFSFGAFGGRADVLELMNPNNPDALPHAGTYNNNVFTMQTGVVAMRDIFTRSRADKLYEDGERLRDRLNSLCAKASNRVQFTGLGSTMNIHFCGGKIKNPNDLRGENSVLKKLFHLHMLDKGIYAARRGQINLSLPMQQEHFDTIASGVGSFLQRYAYHVREAA